MGGGIRGIEEQRGKGWSCGVQEGTSEGGTAWDPGGVALQGCGELLLLRLLRREKIGRRKRRWTIGIRGCNVDPFSGREQLSGAGKTRVFKRVREKTEGGG